uniref:Mediator of RNA polymerase II transcription subunit 22 n=5 Tax=Meloidogyne TaxID=189290 RepID=A0A6V7VTG1_MELEN|nr:unnamed protein product [Meloidogyne enterolobii]CAD2177451.1 unnamed protein product [Meloidogyne enterolobii]
MQSRQPNINARKSEHQQPNKTIVTKKLLVQEYKDRLKNNIKSLNENFDRILCLVKINDDSSHKANSTGQLSEYYAMREELLARASLMVKATDEVQMLTNDIREFLILRDFNFISTSIDQAESDYKKKQLEHIKSYNRKRISISLVITDIDKELAENSLFRY